MISFFINLKVVIWYLDFFIHLRVIFQTVPKVFMPSEEAVEHVGSYRKKGSVAEFPRVSVVLKFFIVGRAHRAIN